jgi:hypothetical protein
MRRDTKEINREKVSFFTASQWEVRPEQTRTIRLCVQHTHTRLKRQFIYCFFSSFFCSFFCSATTAFLMGTFTTPDFALPYFVKQKGNAINNRE